MIESYESGRGNEEWEVKQEGRPLTSTGSPERRDFRNPMVTHTTSIILMSKCSREEG